MTDDNKKILAGTAVGTLGIKGAITAKNIHAIKRDAYQSFDEVLHNYKDVKKGDMLMFQDSAMPGKIHPLLITHGTGPDASYLEVYPGKRILHTGTLRNKLEYVTHDVGGKKFVPSATSVLGSIHRAHDLDEAKFDTAIKTMVKRRKELKYSPFELAVDINKDCKGTCVTYADGILRKATGPRAATFLPNDLAKAVPELRASKVKLTPNISALPLSMILGGTLAATQSDDKTTRKIGIGTALAGTGLAANHYTRYPTNFGIGFASHGIGAQTLKNIMPNASHLTRRTVGAGILGASLIGAAALGNKMLN